MRDQLLRCFAQSGQGVNLKSHLFQTFNGRHLGFGQGRRYLAPSIGKETQWACARDPRIQLPQRPRRRIARIGKGFVAVFLLAGIQRIKIGVGHIDFAAHF